MFATAVHIFGGFFPMRSHAVIHVIIMLQKNVGVFTTNFLCFLFLEALLLYYKELTILHFLPK